ncbi:MAG: 30S ribosomal protein S4 [Firmicutes bacterium]|nr:30S ribosomal protein S4 [Bacillota bacterium]
MARYTEAVCRLCRREGHKLFLKGERCYTPKCAIDRRTYPPGQHGQRRRKETEFGIQLREKQKVRRIYGVMERQFRSYYEEANRREGVTGEILLQLLETRLDNVVFRLGFALSRPEARQLVRHGHFLVNGKKVNIPSFQCKVGDVITVLEKSASSPKFKDIREFAAQHTHPEWLEKNAENLSGSVLALPRREDVQDVPIEEHLIIERYSR